MCEWGTGLYVDASGCLNGQLGCSKVCMYVCMGVCVYGTAGCDDEERQGEEEEEEENRAKEQGKERPGSQRRRGSVAHTLKSSFPCQFSCDCGETSKDNKRRGVWTGEHRGPNRGASVLTPRSFPPAPPRPPNSTGFKRIG